MKNDHCVLGPGLPVTVLTVIEFTEFIWWNVLFADGIVAWKKGVASITPERWFSEISEWKRSLPCELSDSADHLIKWVESRPELYFGYKTKIQLGGQIHNPESILAGMAKDKWVEAKATTNSYLWSAIRKKYQLRFTAETIGVIHRFAQDAQGTSLSDQVSWTRFSSFVESLSSESKCSNLENYLRAFILSCRMLGFVRVQFDDRIVVESYIDGEFILNKLFGTPSSIPGLDQLFGGGGIRFGEVDCSQKQELVIPGRVILVKGQFGAGKTSLALSIASGVAKSQGVAWYFPLEASSDECRMYLDTLGQSNTFGPPFEIIDDDEQIDSFLYSRAIGHAKGAILITSASKQSFTGILEDVIQAIDETAKVGGNRTFIIDPINSILDISEHNHRERRAELMAAIGKIKLLGANLIIAAETETSSSQGLEFIENVADVVVSLESQDGSHGYSQRFFRILKCRLQREQRGKHPFSIKAGLGLEIYPSSAAMAAKIRSRRLMGGTGNSVFGWRDLDKMLGKGAFSPGDVIVIEGDSGCMKTHLGVLFACASEEHRGIHLKRPNNSLILALGDRKTTIFKMTNDEGNHWIPKRSKKLIIKEGLAAGFIQPGRVFSQIDEAFDSCTGGTYIDRVWIDNLWRWAKACPAIRDDETFGQTLIDYFRRKRVTALYTCRDVTDAGDLQKAIIDSANVHIKMSRVDYKGHNLLLVRILKTRSMLHHKEYFTLEYDGTDLSISERGNMLIVDNEGSIRTITASLYFHEESPEQQLYLEDTRKVLRPLLGTDVKLNSEDRTALITATKQTALSTIDELQVVQLDEYQTAVEPKSGDLALVSWPEKIVGTGVLPTMLPKKVVPHPSFKKHYKEQTQRERRIQAVPYYHNIPFLVIDRRVFPKRSSFDSWTDIYEALLNLRKSSETEKFEFSKISNESFVCWLVELILCELIGRNIEPNPQAVLNVLVGANGASSDILHEVCKLYRALGHESYLEYQKATASDLAGKAGNNQYYLRDLAPAAIARQWFSTLGNYYRRIPESDRHHYQVIGLPRNLGVSGEWYLGVPSNSAAPKCAETVISFLISDSQQIARLRRGVGLPTKPHLVGTEKFTSTDMVRIPTAAISETIKCSFKRSTLKSYAQFAPLVALHLKKLLEIPAGYEDRIAELATMLSRDVSAIVDGKTTQTHTQTSVLAVEPDS